jgi:hypothetical protein
MDSPQPKLLSLCNKFVGDIYELTSGDQSKPEFFQYVREQFLELKLSLKATAPAFNIQQTGENSASGSPRRNTRNKKRDVEGTTLVSQY